MPEALRELVLEGCGNHLGRQLRPFEKLKNKPCRQGLLRELTTSFRKTRTLGSCVGANGKKGKRNCTSILRESGGDVFDKAGEDVFQELGGDVYQGSE